MSEKLIKHQASYLKHYVVLVIYIIVSKRTRYILSKHFVWLST